MSPRKLAMLCLLICALATVALAADKTRIPAAEMVSETPSAGMQIAIDPVTGQYRQPTPEEAMILAEGLKSILNDSSEGLDEIAMPEGGFAVDLEDRFQNVFVAFLQPEGDVTHDCLSSPVQVDAAIAAAAAANSGAK